MINSNGVIQNNKTASDFIRNQRKLNTKYPILSKEKERSMIEQYAKLKLVDGKPVWNDKYECEFEWIGDEDNLREKLVMHNLQAVTKISTKHCQDTRDYDNMYAKGLFGLTRAANLFHPFRLVVKNGKIQKDANGNYSFIKFITVAQSWIFKYIMDEFYNKSVKIDNNSTSINEFIHIHNKLNKSLTFENYLSDTIAPEIEPQKDIVDIVSAYESDNIISCLQEYIETSSNISSIERDIIEEKFYNGNKNVKKLAKMFNLSQEEVLENQESALSKLREYLLEEHGIENLSDIM